jgi:hypothetical protein
MISLLTPWSIADTSASLIITGIGRSLARANSAIWPNATPEPEARVAGAYGLGTRAACAPGVPPKPSAATAPNSNCELFRGVCWRARNDSNVRPSDS